MEYWRPRHLLAAIDGVAFALPTTLGSVLLVYLHVGPAYQAAGILAAIVGLVLVHLCTLGSSRPAMFSARLFEATTLAAMLAQLGGQLRVWGMADTPEVRLAFLCLIAGGAGIVKWVLYLLRADVLTRYIPAPVFAGFANSIALLLIVSQWRALHRLLAAGEPAAWLLLVTGAAGAAMLLLRLRQSPLPAAAVGLAVGALVAAALKLWGGVSFTMLASGGWPSSLPLASADFTALVAPHVPHTAVVLQLLLNMLILGVMAFINSTVTTEIISQYDGLRERGLAPRLAQAAAVTLAGAAGSLVLTVSQQASGAAQRTVHLQPLTIFWAALFFALFYATGFVLWMPVGAVCGVMLADAWFFVDRRSVRDLGRWCLRRPLSTNARADLALVVAVTLSAALINMVAAVVVGIFLGLLLFAMRNARRPVQHIWTGLQLRSNCARPRRDLALLDAGGERIRVFELDGDLSFAAASALHDTAMQRSEAGQWVVLDWTRARHVDSSVLRAVSRLQAALPARGVVLLHAGVRAGTPLAEDLAGQLSASAVFADLDHALEWAENALLDATRVRSAAEAGDSVQESGLMRGLSEAERALVLGAMCELHFEAGQTVLQAGAPSDELLLVLKGSASVEVRDASGTSVRLSTVLPGATLGEIGFLDGAPRSANVVASTELWVASLGRAQFDGLSRSHPAVLQRLLANVAVEIAARLRSVSAMAVARNRR